MKMNTKNSLNKQSYQKFLNIKCIFKHVEKATYDGQPQSC